ncbi:hypothetical protein XBJ1_1896 [Xenorhabdus bovienii SS-2004]|uniref:Uncharacterized protein n=1 Tax=Xenorhabdus bovienii (strain SS-2004) TaxID=406818 RepID=D3V2Q7_XENBS|nr:hypothetical protein XBJ1_1896 [Xenorhabdus bovienii SS-2004]
MSNRCKTAFEYNAQEYHNHGLAQHYPIVDMVFDLSTIKHLMYQYFDIPLKNVTIHQYYFLEPGEFGF